MNGMHRYKQMIIERTTKSTRIESAPTQEHEGLLNPFLKPDQIGLTDTMQHETKTHTSARKAEEAHVETNSTGEKKNKNIEIIKQSSGADNVDNNQHSDVTPKRAQLGRIEPTPV